MCSKSFCHVCGAATITHCQSCKEHIRGYYHRPDVTLTYPVNYGVPSYCNNCGKAYPWTEGRIRAAQDLADELDLLTEQEKQDLKDSIVDMVRDTPKATVAAERFKMLWHHLDGCWHRDSAHTGIVVVVGAAGRRLSPDGIASTDLVAKVKRLASLQPFQVDDDLPARQVKAGELGALVVGWQITVAGHQVDQLLAQHIKAGRNAHIDDGLSSCTLQ